MDQNQITIPTTDTIIRCIIGLVVLVNLVLSAFGKAMLPFGNDDQTYLIISTLITVGYNGVWMAWKNTSLTRGAKNADRVMRALKSGAISVADVDKLLDGADEVKFTPAEAGNE